MRNTNILNNNLHKLFAGLIALVLVAGMTSPAYAGIPMPNCTIEPTSAVVEVSEKDGSGFVDKQIWCSVDLTPTVDVAGHDCINYDIFAVGIEGSANHVDFTEQVTNDGPLESEHCTVTWAAIDAAGNVIYLDQELWINIPESKLIGGTVGGLDTTTLLVAGAQSNMGLWSLALVGAVAVGAAVSYKVRSNKTKQ